MTIPAEPTAPDATTPRDGARPVRGSSRLDRGGSRLGRGGLTAITAGGAAAVLVAASLVRHVPGWFPTVYLLAGIVWIASGAVAWRRRPDSSIGPLLSAAGFAWYAPALGVDPSPALRTAHLLLDPFFLPIAAHAVLTFPTGRVTGRADRALVVALYTVGVGGYHAVVVLMPRGHSLVALGGPDPTAALQLARVLNTIAVGLALWFAASVTRRWIAGTPRARRAYGPVLLAAAGSAVIWGLSQALQLGAFGHNNAAWVWDRLPTVAVPVAILAGVLRSRLARSAVSDLVVAVGTVTPAGLRDLLARALDDPELRVAYWVPATRSYVDLSGRPVDLCGAAPRAARVIVDGDAPVAVLIHDAALHDEAELLDAVAATARLALANARLQAELRAQLDEVRASRVRLVEAADAERRRIERNLHDGAQQRLIALAVALHAARSSTSDPELGAVLDAASAELAAARAELRELARGVHPAVLTDFGLAAALESLAEQAPVPVRVDADVPRLPPAVEAAAYYVAAEALTNAVKHAAPSRVTLAAALAGTGDGAGALRLTATDDGAGGARPGTGTGLPGMLDRVRALDGRLTIDSTPGAGTRISAEIPCGEAPCG